MLRLLDDYELLVLLDTDRRH